jgi:hypothetical protein
MSMRASLSSSPLAALLAAALVGCSGSSGGGGPSTLPPTSCLPGCAGTRAYDAVSYALQGHFDWATRTLVASEAITLKLPAGASPVVALDAAVTVTAVQAGGHSLPWAVAGSLLKVDLTPMAPGTGPVTFTVDYTAATSDALIASSSRTDDPVRSRVVFTDSEPNRGHQWMVQKDDPSDPALFSVELTVATDEDVIANGERTADAPVAGGRRVAFALDKPIPTYLMAFAAGQLEHADGASGTNVPLAIWYRRGLSFTPSDTLSALASAMATFEPLIGQYPFTRYAVVLLPEYGGGMENATVSFQGERFSQGPGNFDLHAHELAHQWFGDRVTMHGYDDVWIKEGMATLLAAEASRACCSDVGGFGRLLASRFSFYANEAIVDPTLTGLDKYNTGPYGRSAALLTQLRARLGEASFWGHLRAFLDGFAAQGSATGEQFVRSFSPDLTESGILQVLGILPQFDLPVFTVELLPAGGVTSQVRLSLSDPAGLMLVPYQVTVVDAAGVATTSTLTAQAPLLLDLPPGGYLAPDEGEVFPDDPVAGVVFSMLSPWMLPVPGSPAGTAFLSRSAAHQERALSWAGLPGLTLDSFGAFYDALDSGDGTVLALSSVCWQLRGLPEANRADWVAALAPVFTSPRTALSVPAFGRCGPGLGATLLTELQGLVAAPITPKLARLEYLLWFDYGADGLAPLSQVATAAPSLRLRDQALWRLAYQTSGTRYSPIPTGQLAAWQAFFRDRLVALDSWTRMRPTWLGVVGLQDASALGEAGLALQRVAMPAYYQQEVVCEASRVATSTATPAAWTAFQAAAEPWSNLSPAAATLLADPSGCAALGY